VASSLVVLAGALATLLASACGQKGPLYLPDDGAIVVTRPAPDGVDTTIAPATPARSTPAATPASAVPPPAAAPVAPSGTPSVTPRKPQESAAPPQ
jgi:predicted small lipoprotein YifL